MVPKEKINFPVWQIVGKFIKQDLTKISMPVVLNEPASTLQKQCEMMAFSNLLEKAATIEDSI